MTVTAYGSVPFPPGTNAPPLQACAQSFADCAMGLASAATSLTGAANTTGQGLVGAAGTAAVTHFTDTTATVTGVGSALAQAGKVINAFATALAAAETDYSAAATTEMALRAAIVVDWEAVGAAMLAEGKAVTALETAGGICASQLMMLAGKVALAELAPIGEMIGGIDGELVSLVGGVGSVVGNATGILQPDGQGTFEKNPLGTIISGSGTITGAVLWPTIPKPTAPASSSSSSKPASTTTTPASTTTPTTTATPASTTTPTTTSTPASTTTPASAPASPKPVGTTADAVPAVSPAKSPTPA